MSRVSSLVSPRLVSLPLCAALSLVLASACGDDIDAAGPDAGAGGGADAGPGSDPDADPGDEVAPIERGHAGGAPLALVLDGDRAYITIGPRLAIWDVGDPAAPQLVGESDPLPGMPRGVAVAGERAYVPVRRSDQDGEVHVIDISNPAAPAVLGSVRVQPEGASTWPTGAAVFDTTLYVADPESGIALFDLADPDTPALAEVLQIYGASRLQVVDRRLYYTGRTFFGDVLVGALDLDAELAFLGEVVLPGAIDARVTAGHAVVGVGSSGLLVYDMSDPTQPAELYHDDQVFGRSVAASGDIAWVPAWEGLYRVDLTGDLVVTGPVAMPSEGADASDTSGALLAVVTDRGDLLLVDSAGEAPALLSATGVSVCAMCGGVAATSDVLHVADLAAGIRTAGLGDLVQLGHGYPSKRMDLEDVVVADGIAYAADWFFGVRAFDVSDPTSIQQIGELDTPGAPGGVDYEGGLLYLAEGTEGGALRVIDVSDPTAMRELGAVLTSKAQEVDAVGHLAFVADEAVYGSGGMRIFDVSDPTSIQQIGHYMECQFALDVAVTGDVAVLACSGDQFHLVDVSDPSNPTQLAIWRPSHELSSAWSVAARGDRAYLGSNFGVVALDISDPASPELIAEMETPYTVRGLTSPAPGRVIAATSLGGIFQWQLPDQPGAE